jgi:hypothetical protein
MLWFGARLQLLLVALVVLLAAAASDRSHYFCKMMGRAVAECCCPSSHEAGQGEGAAARAPDCCELMASSKQPLAAYQQATAPGLAAPPVAVLLASLEYSEPSFRLVETPPTLARAPPGIGPPLFISHCALLI